MTARSMTVEMLVRLADQFSAPGGKLRDSMHRISAEAVRMRTELGKRIRTGFTEDNLAAALQRNERQITASRSRLLGAGTMVATIAAPVMSSGNFEEDLIHFGNLAEMGADRIAQLGEALNALRRQTGKSNIELLRGLDTYVGNGMGLDEALASMRSTGRAATATRSQMEEMSASGFAVIDNLGVAPDRLAQAFDIMAKSGKEGSFELGAMARKFPEITAGAKSLGMEGTDAVASLAAALQIAMKSAGSEDQAATNMTNFLGKITAPDTVRKFRDFGVDIEAEMSGALERGVDPLEHMLFKIREMTGGDAFKMGELFADKQVLDFLRAMIPNMEEYARIKQEALGASGVIDADYARVMGGFNQQFRELKNSISALTVKSGVLLPILTDIVTDIRFGVEAVADWTSANPELTETLIKGGAALLAFGAGTRVLSYGFHLMAGGALRTAGLFLKFDKSGRNISLVARSLRAARTATGALYRIVRAPVRWGLAPLRWTTSLVPRIPWSTLLGARFSVASLLRPVAWTARLIPAVPWVAMAGGKFALSALLRPVVWTAKMVPALPWLKLVGGRFALTSAVRPLIWTAALLPNFTPALARFVGFRTAASGEMGGLARNVSRHSQAMSRSLNSIRWNAFSAGIMGVMALNSLPETNQLPEFQERNRVAMDQNLRALPGMGSMMGAFDWAVAKIHGRAAVLDKQFMPDDQQLRAAVDPIKAASATGGNLPTPERLTDLRRFVDELRAGVEATQAELAALPQPSDAYDMGSPQYQQSKAHLEAQTRDLELVEVQLLEAERQAESLGEALDAVFGSGNAPEISTAGIEAAVRRLEELDIRAAGHAARLGEAVAPLQSAMARPAVGAAPPQASEYVAGQPNVTVESTFESQSQVDVNVSVDMPVHITREQRNSNAEIARRAGSAAGAETERRVRRALDDAANLE